MKILHDLIASLPEDVPIRSVVVGLRWTVVCSRYCGLSATLTSDGAHKTAPWPDAHRLQKKSARELAELALALNRFQGGRRILIRYEHGKHSTPDR